MSDRMDLTKVVQGIVDDATAELRVCMPGRIVEYDADTHLASVQPLLKRKFYGASESVLLPIVNNVPVVHPRTASAMVRLPVAPDDIVMMVFADRSIERWLDGDGTEVEPQDIRQHHISDAYCILGGYPSEAPITANNPDALEIFVVPGTKLTIGNGTDELVELAHGAFTDLKELCDNLIDVLLNIQLLTVTGVTGGPGVSGVPVNAPIFATLQTAVDGISEAVQEKIESIENLKT